MGSKDKVLSLSRWCNLWNLDQSTADSKATQCLIRGRNAKIAMLGGIQSGKGKNWTYCYSL